MKSISILNFKGGIGKTTIAINLSDVLSRQGKKVLLIDGDRQRHTSTILPDYDRDNDYQCTLLEVLQGTCTLAQAIREARPNFSVVPSHRDLDKAATYLTVSGTRTLKLLQTQVKALQGYDYVFFDHSPSYGKITNALLMASQYMLIPVQLEPFSVEGVVDMINKLTRELNEIEHEVENAGIIPNNLDYTKAMTQAYLSDIKGYFEELVTTPIRTDARISRSQEKHKTVYEYDPRSKGSQDFEALAQFILAMEEVRT